MISISFNQLREVRVRISFMAWIRCNHKHHNYELTINKTGGFATIFIPQHKQITMFCYLEDINHIICIYLNYAVVFYWPLHC